METLVAFLLLCVEVAFFYKVLVGDNKPSTADHFDFSKSEKELDVLQEQRNQLRVLEALKTDIDICSAKDNVCKYFTLSWSNEATGEQFEYEFVINDSNTDTANAMKNLAIKESYQMRIDYQNNLNMIGVRSGVSTSPLSYYKDSKASNVVENNRK